MSIFPSWRYHKTEKPKIIKSEKEESAEWKDSPAHFEKDEPKHEQEIVSDEKPEKIELLPIKEIKPKKKK